MKQVVFFRRNDCLEPSKAQYWKDLLYRTVKVGTEIEFALPKGVRKDDFMPELVAALSPSKSLERLGRHGVLDVISEHCGIEIQVIGRQPFFPALREQLSGILAHFPTGVRVRPTCGLHFHVLTVGLSEPVPEIVLANVWNMTRRYAPELRFLTSCGPSLAALCRRRSHCSHLEMVRWSPGSHSMQEIKAALQRSNMVPEHQNFLNLEHVSFNRDGSIGTLHYENRFPDADLSPTSIAAKVFLFLAILLKAVDLSQYGVIHVGNIQQWRRKVDLLGMLSNNDGKLATSDTSRVDSISLGELRAESRELLDFLSPVFRRLARVSGEAREPHPALAVLRVLAETPISLLHAKGFDWSACERTLGRSIGDNFDCLDSVDRRLMRFIDLGELTNIGNVRSWRLEAARQLLLTPEELEAHLDRLETWRDLLWDSERGTMAFRV